MEYEALNNTEIEFAKNIIFLNKVNNVWMSLQNSSIKFMELKWSF